MNANASGFFRLGVKPWGLLTAGGAVLCASTLCGFLGRFSWFLDLFSHFRVQYGIGLASLAVLLLVGRRYRTAAIFLGFACVNLALVLPLYFGPSILKADAATELRAMLINVNTSFGDPERVKAVVTAADPDILVLEEINARWLRDMGWLATSHPHSLTKPREDNFGIGLFSKLPLADSEVVFLGDSEVPTIVATVVAPGTNLRVIATHPLPPSGWENSRLRNDHLERLPTYVRPDMPVLLLGDLNTTPWNYYFNRLLARSGLRDSARGFGVQPTWPAFTIFLRIPLDHCLHSSDIVILDRQIGEDVSSDHFPLIIDFVVRTKQELEKTPR